MPRNVARMDLVVNDVVAPTGGQDTIWPGGRGWFIVRATTWGGGNVRLQYRYDLVNTTTWLDVDPALAVFTADGIVAFEGPPGVYRASVTTATGVTAQVLGTIM